MHLNHIFFLSWLENKDIRGKGVSRGEHQDGDEEGQVVDGVEVKEGRGGEWFMDRGGDEQENRRQGREEDDNKYKGGVGGEEVEGEEGDV